MISVTVLYEIANRPAEDGSLRSREYTPQNMRDVKCLEVKAQYLFDRPRRKSSLLYERIRIVKYMDKINK